MTMQEFTATLVQETPPAKLSQALIALWLDAKNDWVAAHEAAQLDSSKDCAWVHAYLHRKAGDLSNASYWYSEAGKKNCKDELQKEWREIATQLME